MVDNRRRAMEQEWGRVRVNWFRHIGQANNGLRGRWKVHDDFTNTGP
jgi:hypothetical protein